MFLQPYLSGIGFLCKLHTSVHPFPMWSALPPRSTMNESESLILPSAFLFFDCPAYPCHLAQERLGYLPSSCFLFPYMPRPTTPADPRESHLIDSSVWTSVTLTTSSSALCLFPDYNLMRLNMLQEVWLPVACKVLCVHFT